MTLLEEKMAQQTRVNWKDFLKQYGDFQEEFTLRDGYSMDSEIDKVIKGCN